jgi:hypothetical protein
MNSINQNSLSINQFLNLIGQKIYSHKENIQINHDDNNVIFPSPNMRVIEEAIQEINESLYHILHVARYSGKYCLVLTKFKNKIYKVFYNYNENNTVSYSYNEYFI